MAQTYKVEKGGALSWPRNCVVCGSSEVVAEKAYGSSVDNVALPYGVMLSISEYTLSFPYPLCPAHKRFWLATRIALYSLVLVIAFLLAFLFETLPDHTSVLWVVAAAVALVFYVLAVTLPPVRVYRIRDDYYMLRIRSDGYARDFERANPGKIRNRSV